MKVRSSLVWILAALFVFGCATAGPKSTPLISDSQLISEIEFNWEGSEDVSVPAVTGTSEILLSDVRYHLENWE